MLWNKLILNDKKNDQTWNSCLSVKVWIIVTHTEVHSSAMRQEDHMAPDMTSRMILVSVAYLHAVMKDRMLGSPLHRPLWIDHHDQSLYKYLTFGRDVRLSLRSKHNGKLSVLPQIPAYSQNEKGS